MNNRAKGKSRMVTLKALLDTGATATLISSEHVEKQKKNQCNKTI